MSEAPTTDDGDDPLAALEGADSNAETGSPEARLKEARKQIALALDDLDVDGVGRIPVFSADSDLSDDELTIVATGDRVTLVGDGDEIAFDRDDALLVSVCLRILSLDI